MPLEKICNGLEILTVPVFCRMVKATPVYAAFSPNVSNNEYELASMNEICHVSFYSYAFFFFSLDKQLSFLSQCQQ